MRTLLYAIIFLLTLASTAQAEAVRVGPWDIADKFKGDEARLELSGATCPGTSGELKWCLAVNDQKQYAQFFKVRLSEKKLDARKDKVLRMLPEEHGSIKFKDMDAEGAANDGRFVYVTGSHGLSRKKAKYNHSQFFVFRFPVDPVSGKPPFEISDENVASEIERNGRLRLAILNSPTLRPFAQFPLKNNGANIEGLAASNGWLYFGFRGASVNGSAVILRGSATGLFGGGPLEPKEFLRPLGEDIGIRDLAAVSGGILVLSGNVSKTKAAQQVYLWSPASGELKTLGVLGLDDGKKAETLLVLEEETGGAGGSSYRALILYDGKENGGPVEYRLTQ